MGLESSEQTYVYEHLWRPMEQLFVYETQRDSNGCFLPPLLDYEAFRIPKQGRVYEEFKLYHLNCEFGTIIGNYVTIYWITCKILYKHCIQAKF